LEKCEKSAHDTKRRQFCKFKEDDAIARKHTNSLGNIKIFIENTPSLQEADLANKTSF